MGLCGFQCYECHIVASLDQFICNDRGGHQVGLKGYQIGHQDIVRVNENQQGAKYTKA